MRRVVWRRRLSASAGITLVELVVVLAVLSVLAAVAMPLAEVTVKRSKELELRRTLRELREGIDLFRAEYDKAKGNAQGKREIFVQRVSVDRSGYPATLEELVETKILRRIPRDPMASDSPWVTRSYSDSLDSTVSDARDVWDVRSSSKATALDSTTYDTW